MTKAQLQKKLDEMGIAYTPEMTNKALEELISTEEKKRVDEAAAQVAAEAEAAKAREQAVMDDLTGKNKMTVDEMVGGGKRTGAGVIRPSGILIPNQVLVQLKPTQYRWVSKCSGDKCIVVKIDHRDHEQEVRVYEKSLHGEKFSELSTQFVQKMNQREGIQ